MRLPRQGICLPHKRKRPGREGKEFPVPLFNVCIVEDSVAGFPYIKRSAGLRGSRVALGHEVLADRCRVLKGYFRCGEGSFGDPGNRIAEIGGEKA